MNLRLAIFLGVVSVVCCVASAAKRPYIAAAVEHARFGDENDPPSLVVEENLKRYKKAAEIASSKGADIIVYPEYGIFYPADRIMLKNFVENIPDPKKFRINPCKERDLYSDRPILLTLSCMAKNNSIFVVANMGDIQSCTGEPDCREDGVFHYNTNVVFDRNGTLLLKYYKEHLFYELSMDVPIEEQDSTFETDFGTFATYICFDVAFKRMSEVARWPNVDGVMFSTMWFESTPQLVSMPLFQGWAIANNATLVVSNIHRPGNTNIGSGIFHGTYGVLDYTYSPDGISKVVIANVPASGPPMKRRSEIIAYKDSKIWYWGADKEAPEICSLNLLKYSPHPNTDFRCYEENTSNYTLVKLTKPSGFVEACNHGMCCALNYTADHMMEDFYLGVYNGTFTYGERYLTFEEDCFLTRCDAVDGKPCSTFPRKTNTNFHRAVLSSTFSTSQVYPAVISSNSRLVPFTKWRYDIFQRNLYHATIQFQSEEGVKLIYVGYKARNFDKDPLYVR